MNFTPSFTPYLIALIAGAVLMVIYFKLPRTSHVARTAASSPCRIGRRKRSAMKFGPRKPSLKKMIAARTSPARFIRHSLGFKAPRGWGWLTNPKKAAYNRVYNRTTCSIFKIGKSGCLVPIIQAALLLALLAFLIR